MSHALIQPLVKSALVDEDVDDTPSMISAIFSGVGKLYQNAEFTFTKQERPELIAAVCQEMKIKLTDSILTAPDLTSLNTALHVLELIGPALVINVLTMLQTGTGFHKPLPPNVSFMHKMLHCCASLCRQ